MRLSFGPLSYLLPTPQPLGDPLAAARPIAGSEEQRRDSEATA
jgi:hypothetical protein